MYEYRSAVLLHSDLVDRDMAVWPAAWDVAVLIVVHNREDRITAAIHAAAHMVPLESVFVIVDDSTDRTVESAEQCGVQLAETMRPMGRTGALAAGLQAFQLLDRFEFVLLVDADTTLDSHYLEQAMALFADPSVAAVDGRITPSWSGVIAAYRARAYALARWRGTRSPSSSVPGAARIYRSSVLREIVLDQPEDFDATRQIYRKQLGQVAFCPSARVVLPQPTTVADHWRQSRRWASAYWQAVRRHGARGTVWLVLGLLVMPVSLALIAILPVIPIVAVLVDYLLTVAVVVRQKQPRYLLPGLLFPVLRVLDAAIVLTSWRRPADGWLQFGARRRTPVYQWILLGAAAAAVVVRVAMSTVSVSPAEPALVDAAFANSAALSVPPVDTALAVTTWQLDLYTAATGAFDRYASTITSARELSVVAVALALAGLALVARLLRLRPWTMAVAVGMLAVSGLVMTALVPVGPGVLAGAWVALAAAAGLAAATRPNGLLIGVAVVLAVLALATAPVLVVPIGVGAAAWFVTSGPRVWATVATVVGGSGLAFVFWRTGLLGSAVSVLSDNQRFALLGVIALAVLGGVTVDWARPVAAGVFAGALLACFSSVDVLAPVLALGAAVLVGATLDEAVSRGRLVSARWLASGAAIAGSVATVLWIPSAARPDHSGLSQWMAAQLDRDAKLVVPSGLWSDVARDRRRAGLPVAVRSDRTGPAGVDELAATPDGSGPELARFSPDVIVRLTVPGDYLSTTERAGAGRQLANNVRLHTNDQVKEAMRAGQVDLRTMTVLAQLCRDHEVSVTSTGKPVAEQGTTLPDRMITVSTIDGRPAGDDLVDWLQAQQPPYAPAEVRLTDDGAVIGWRLPALHDPATN